MLHRGILGLKAVMADPPRFEHGFKAPQAPVISRLHYGSSEPVDLWFWFNFDGASEIHIEMGKTVFQRGSANFLDLGPSLGFGVL